MPALDHDIVPGVAAKLVAAGVRLALAPAVLLPGVPGAVKAVAVELDRQLVGSPAAVDQATACQAIGFWQWQARFSHQLQELMLELAEREAGLAADQLAQLSRPSGVGAPPERILDVAWSRAVLDVGFMNGPSELTGVNNRGQVDESPSGGRDPDAAPGSHVPEIERARLRRRNATD